MIRIGQLKLEPNHTKAELVQKIAKTLCISEKEIFKVDLRAAEAMNIARRADPINEFTQGVIKI